MHRTKTAKKAIDRERLLDKVKALVDSLHGQDDLSDQETRLLLEAAELARDLTWISPRVFRNIKGLIDFGALNDAAFRFIPIDPLSPDRIPMDFLLGHTNGGLTIHCRVGQTADSFADTVPLAILRASLVTLLALEADRIAPGCPKN